MLLSHDRASIGGHIEVLAITESSWRICDDRYPEHDARRLLAYVEQVGDHFEMMWMRPSSGSIERFDRLADVLVAVSERIRHSAPERPAA